ncbi:MAG: OsmC family protein [Acetobacteraceae bacterium]
MLWYLHLAAEAGVVVLGYVDRAEGEMVLDADGGGRFTSIVLRPAVTLAEGADAVKAEALHTVAHSKCFIARSVNFPISVRPFCGSACASNSPGAASGAGAIATPAPSVPAWERPAGAAPPGGWLRSPGVTFQSGVAPGGTGGSRIRVPPWPSAVNRKFAAT